MVDTGACAVTAPVGAIKAALRVVPTGLHQQRGSVLQFIEKLRRSAEVYASPQAARLFDDSRLR
jgi:hypothetical protein